MDDRLRAATPDDDPESYGKVIAHLFGLVAGLAVLAFVVLRTPSETPPKPAAIVASVEPEPTVEPVVEPPAPPPAPPSKPKPTRPAPPTLDTAAVARAEAELDAAARDRARGSCADEAASRLATAADMAAAESRAAKNLAFRVRDPSTRVASASARGGFLKAENDKLKKELDAIARAPRPQTKTLANKNPVARASEGDEYHFEVHHNRVTFIDLDRLIGMVKADAQMRIRLTNGARVVQNQVGPVGAFSLRYIMGRALPPGFDDLVERRGSLQYELRGWEVIPTFNAHGETYDVARRPVSEFSAPSAVSTPTTRR